MILTVCLVGFTGLAAAESVRTYLERVETAVFELVSDEEFGGKPLAAGSFDATLAEELDLQSYSVWEARPQSTGGEWNSARLSVYEWLDSQGAFGAYTHTVAQIEPATVQWAAPSADAIRTDQRLIGWKGRFFVEIFPDQGSVSAVEPLFQSVLESIDLQSLYPFTVSQLPDQGMLRQSRRYYLGPHSLGSDPTFLSELLDHIGFQQGLEVAAATYEPGPVRLFVMGYPNSSVAQRYHGQLLQESAQTLVESGFMTKLTGPLVCLARGPREQVAAVLANVEYEAEIQWLHGKSVPEKTAEKSELLSFFGLITSSIFFTAAALIVLIVVGFGVGAFRFGWHQRFPASFRKGEMIRMDIDTRKVLESSPVDPQVSKTDRAQS